MEERDISIAVIETRTSTYRAVKNPLEKIASAISGLDEHRAERYNFVLGPEWFFLKSAFELYSEKEYASILDSVKELSLQYPGTLIIPGSIAWKRGQHYQNTAPAIADGEVLHQYTKRRDGGDKEFAANCKALWEEGKREGNSNSFSWNGLDLAVQICADHFKWPSEFDVDLHFVVSCGLGIRPNSLIWLRKDGVAVLSDGCSTNGRSKIEIKDNNSEIEPYQTIKHESSDPLSCYTVQIYKIKIPERIE